MNKRYIFTFLKNLYYSKEWWWWWWWFVGEWCHFCNEFWCFILSQWKMFFEFFCLRLERCHSSTWKNISSPLKPHPQTIPFRENFPSLVITNHSKESTKYLLRKLFFTKNFLFFGKLYNLQFRSSIS